jgi:molecular chaperone Hsp33
MNDNDNLQRFLFENASVRGEIVRLEDSYQEIMKRHPYPPVIHQLLGEALVAVALLTSIIKFKGRVTLQFRGNGKLKLLFAQCNHSFHLRGLAQWDGDFKEEEMAAAIDQGMLAIMMDPDIINSKRYQGIVAWQGQSLAQSIEGYFRDSEQLPTRLWIAVNETRAAGLLLQVLPKERPELYKNEWEHLIHLTDTLTQKELLTWNNQTLLHRLYSEEDVRLFQSVSVKFQCTCSRERSENALLLLGHDEVQEEIKEKQKIVVTCEFCNREFDFDRVDIETIFKKGGHSTRTH